MAKAKSTEVYGLVSKDLGEVGNQVGSAAGTVGQQVGSAAGAVKKTLEVSLFSFFRALLILPRGRQEEVKLTATLFSRKMVCCAIVQYINSCPFEFPAILS